MCDEKDNELMEQLLFRELAFFQAKCEEVRNHLTKLIRCNSTTPNEISDGLKELETIISNIDLHRHLDNCELTDVNFYSGFMSCFLSKRDREHVKFSFQEGLDGPVQTDLSDQDLRKILTIHNCLPLMNLVPFQLASNARKYSAGSDISVKVIMTPTKVFIDVINQGPYIPSGELKAILTSGGRGTNAQKREKVGDGVGLKQIKKIMDLHRGWLDSTFYPSSSESHYSNGGIPYSTFTASLSFVNTITIQEEQVQQIEDMFSDWKNEVPHIVVHDMFGITTNLVKLSQGLEKIRTSDKAYNRELTRCSEVLRLSSNRMSDVLRQYYFYIDKGGDLIMGAPCTLKMQYTVQTTLNQLGKLFYGVKNIHIDPQCDQRLENRNLTSGAYSFFVGFFSLILDNVPNDSTIEVTYSGGKYNQFIIQCDEIDFNGILNDESSVEIWNRIQLYQYMMEEWGWEFSIEGSSILKMML